MRPRALYITNSDRVLCAACLAELVDVVETVDLVVFGETEDGWCEVCGRGDFEAS